MTPKSILRATALACALFVSTRSPAQEKTGMKGGFVLRPGTVRILVMRPIIQVGAQSTGGMYEPNADWTQRARENLTRALAEAQSRLGNRVIGYSEGMSCDGRIVTQYAHLFSAVADSVIEYQFFRGNRLATKKRAGSFEWGVGDGIARLKSLEGADYALFKAGISAKGHKVVHEIPPFAVGSLDELDLPLAPPALESLLASDGLFDGGMRLGVNEPYQIVSATELRSAARTMLLDPCCQIGRHADVEHAARLVCHDIGPTALPHGASVATAT